MMITSQPMVEEFIDVISRAKFRSNYNIPPRIVRLLTKKLIDHQIKIRVPRTTVKVRDPKDIVVLATAVESHADYLVTGDQDLLVLSKHKSIKQLKIVTPVTFINIISP